MARLDPFTTVHKGVRALLFDAVTRTARVELTSDEEVDRLAERIERALELNAMHENAEHAVILPVLEHLAPGAAERLQQMHDALDASAGVVRRAARTLVLTAAGERGVACRALLQALDDLTVTCLAHLRYEETVVSAHLRGSLSEREIDDLCRRMRLHIGEESCSEWRAVLEPAISEGERVLFLASCNGTPTR